MTSVSSECLGELWDDQGLGGRPGSLWTVEDGVCRLLAANAGHATPDGLSRLAWTGEWRLSEPVEAGSGATDDAVAGAEEDAPARPSEGTGADASAAAGRWAWDQTPRTPREEALQRRGSRFSASL